MPTADRPDPASAGPEQIAQAVAVLGRGGMVAFPTETVYGLGADALSAAAVERVFALKGRPATNPLIVHVTGEAMAREVVADWPPEAHRLARAFWPGPLTLVLPRSPRVPDIVTAGGSTVAVRCPDHHVTLALLEAFGRPLVGPSANPSGQVSPTAAEHVRSAFSEDDVYVLDGGPCRGGIESTVLALTDAADDESGGTAPRPRILRPGLVSAEEIEIVLGTPVETVAGAVVVFADDRARPTPTRSATVHESPSPAPLPSPGLLPVHYAPRAPAVAFAARDWPDVLAQRGGGGRIVALARSALSAPAQHTVIAMPDDAAAYAARFYAALREADAAEPALIAIEQPPPERAGPHGAIWNAVADRIARATGAGPARPG